jgi:O-antigen/teichoic acid export membrane protein
MIRGTVQRVWQAANDAIVVNAGSLVGATAVTSLLGVAYWWLATRAFLPEAVGFASAGVAAMTLIGTIGMLGLGTLLIGELPRRPHNAPALVSTALAVSTACSAVLGMLFALIAPYLADDLAPLRESVATVALFTAGVGLTGGTMVLDQAVIGLLRGNIQLARNTIFAVSKLIILAAMAGAAAASSGTLIYVTWVAGLVISVLAIAGLAKPHARDARPRWSAIHGQLRPALKHHLLNLTLQVPNLALPLIVTITLSTTTNAYFYTAWMTAGFVFIGPYALTLALYAVGAGQPRALAEKARFTLRVAFAIAVAGNIVLLLGADLILRVFGAAYADNAATTLRIVGLGVFPLIIKDHFVAFARVQDRLARAIGLVATGAALELILAAAGAVYGGLVWLALGWLLAVSIEAALMLPSVVRTVATPASVTSPVEDRRAQGKRP